MDDLSVEWALLEGLFGKPIATSNPICRIYAGIAKVCPSRKDIENHNRGFTGKWYITTPLRASGGWRLLPSFSDLIAEMQKIAHNRVDKG